VPCLWVPYGAAGETGKCWAAPPWWPSVNFRFRHSRNDVTSDPPRLLGLLPLVAFPCFNFSSFSRTLEGDQGRGEKTTEKRQQHCSLPPHPTPHSLSAVLRNIGHKEWASGFVADHSYASLLHSHLSHTVCSGAHLSRLQVLHRIYLYNSQSVPRFIISTSSSLWIFIRRKKKENVGIGEIIKRISGKLNTKICHCVFFYVIYNTNQGRS
jgi:hypothetical protein